MFNSSEIVQFDSKCDNQSLSEQHMVYQILANSIGQEEVKEDLKIYQETFLQPASNTDKSGDNNRSRFFRYHRRSSQ